MKAVVFEEHGGPDVLHYTDIADPEPKPFEVLIEVKAAGANFNANGVFAAMVILAAVALLSEFLITLLERRLLRWRPNPVADVTI